MPSDDPTTTAASPDALIESMRLDAQSEYGRGWNKGMADAVAVLRSEGWLRETREATP